MEEPSKKEDLNIWLARHGEFFESEYFPVRKEEKRKLWGIVPYTVEKIEQVCSPEHISVESEKRLDRLAADIHSSLTKGSKIDFRSSPVKRVKYTADRLVSRLSTDYDCSLTYSPELESIVPEKGKGSNTYLNELLQKWQDESCTPLNLVILSHEPCLSSLVSGKKWSYAAWSKGDLYFESYRHNGKVLRFPKFKQIRGENG